MPLLWPLCQTLKIQHIMLQMPKTSPCCRVLINKGSREDDEEKDTSAMLIDTKKSILLQTAEAMVGATNGKQFIKKRILFDNGSQRTYITDELRRKLGLEVIGKESIFIKTFW